MSYIKREPLLEILNGLYDHHLTMHNYAADCATQDCVNAVIEAPTADVVEVVRCKDCFYSEKTLSDECPKECSWCRKLCFVTHENHYCSYGERKNYDT